MHQVPACPIVVSAHSSCQLNTHVSEKISREVFRVTCVMDIGNLEAIISGQEKVITQLEQELHHLQSALATETGVSLRSNVKNIEQKIFQRKRLKS